MKCPVCESRKGKRGCLLTTSCICSQCCGTQRKQETCVPCGYFKEPKRDYKNVPAYSPSEMDGDFDRQHIANIIESKISSFDAKNHAQMRDDTALRIIEALLDFYHFNQHDRESDDDLINAGYHEVFAPLENIVHTSREEITKILAAIYFVARRRTKGRREYLDFIKQYVGVNVGSAMRAIPMD